MTRLARRAVLVALCATVVALALAGSWLRPEPEPAERWICQPGAVTCKQLADEAGAEPVAVAGLDR